MIEGFRLEEIGTYVSKNGGSALQPTPILTDHQTVRVFFGKRDEFGVSSVCYFDVTEDGQLIVGESNSPSLAPGSPGMFDENGVVPTFAWRQDKKTYLFFAGYSLGTKVRFQVFGGLAHSSDLELFERISSVPFMDRKIGEELFRVPHSFLDGGTYRKLFYGAGGEFNSDEDPPTPVYDIKSLRMTRNFELSGSKTEMALTGDRLRIARPWAMEFQGEHFLFYCEFREGRSMTITASHLDKKRGWNPVPVENDFATHKEDLGRCYPSVIKTSIGYLAFYNTGDYGSSGIIIARLQAIS